MKMILIYIYIYIFVYSFYIFNMKNKRSYLKKKMFLEL